MSETITLEKLKKELSFFNKMFDGVRIVDPIHKKVLDSQGCSLQETNEICYNYWKSGRICDNCISIRSYNENRSYVKLEHSANSIMVVTAFPIENIKKPTVLELFKDASDSMMIGSGDYNKGEIVLDFVSKMNDMVVKDPLTYLFNRRYINDRLPVDVVKATLEDSPISIILLDIDNFKHINDDYGHLIGDKVLQEVGNTISSIVSEENNWAARYGGDEFIICMNNTNEKKAKEKAEQLRTSINNIVVKFEDKEINTTVSLGVHTMKDAKITAEELINCADRKMYRAKKFGKNCTINEVCEQN